MSYKTYYQVTKPLSKEQYQKEKEWYCKIQLAILQEESNLLFAQHDKQKIPLAEYYIRVDILKSQADSIKSLIAREEI